MQPEKRLTKTEVRALGFSDRLIALLLPEPEKKQNPYYKKAALMSLWKEADVKAAMEKPEFIDYQEKRNKRLLAAEKAIETKRDNLVEKYSNMAEKCIIKHIPMDELRKKTLEAKQEWYDSQWFRRDERDVSFADPETVDRWMVNYVRHNLSDYNEELYGLRGKVGKADAYCTYAPIILKKIAEVYPELREECERQIRDKYLEY